MKIIASLFGFALLALCLSGCASTDDSSSPFSHESSSGAAGGISGRSGFTGNGSPR